MYSALVFMAHVSVCVCYSVFITLFGNRSIRLVAALRQRRAESEKLPDAKMSKCGAVQCGFI